MLDRHSQFACHSQKLTWVGTEKKKGGQIGINTGRCWHKNEGQWIAGGSVRNRNTTGKMSRTQLVQLTVIVIILISARNLNPLQRPWRHRSDPSVLCCCVRQRRAERTGRKAAETNGSHWLKGFPRPFSHRTVGRIPTIDNDVYQMRFPQKKTASIPIIFWILFIRLYIGPVYGRTSRNTNPYQQKPIGSFSSPRHFQSAVNMNRPKKLIRCPWYNPIHFERRMTIKPCFTTLKFNFDRSSYQSTQSCLTWPPAMVACNDIGSKSSRVVK